MTLKPQKLDITDRVIGKLKNGQILLYLENEKIGKIQLPEAVTLELEHHFTSEQEKIYQHVSAVEQPQARYTDCDEGGWC